MEKTFGRKSRGLMHKKHRWKLLTINKGKEATMWISSMRPKITSLLILKLAI